MPDETKNPPDQTKQLYSLTSKSQAGPVEHFIHSRLTAIALFEDLAEKGIPVMLKSRAMSIQTAEDAVEM